MKASGIAERERGGLRGGLRTAAATLGRVVVGLGAPRWHVGALVILRDEVGRVALLEHRLRPKPWGLPGGFAAWPEAPIEAAARECAEELRLEVDPGRLRFVAHLTGERLPYLEVVFAYETRVDEARKADIVLQDREVSAVRWVEPAALERPDPGLAMLDRHRQAIVAFLRGDAGVR